MKELSALQHTNTTLSHQRDESRRVVLHLRSLIDGQTHHMEHIVRSLNDAPELSNYIQEGYEDMPEDVEDHESVTSSEIAERDPNLLKESDRSVSDTSSADGNKIDDEKVTPEMESRFFSPLTSSTRGNRLSMSDVADRHLRDKTDAIAYIIRNISDQCAAAVEGLHLANNAENEDDDSPEPELQSSLNNMGHKHTQSDGDVSMHTDVSQLGAVDDSADHDSGHGESTGFLTPKHEKGRSQSRVSSTPPTPDLVSGNEDRSNTSMSEYSNSTSQLSPARDSMQPYLQEKGHGIKILDADDSAHDSGTDVGPNKSIKKRTSGMTAAAMVPA